MDKHICKYFNIVKKYLVSDPTMGYRVFELSQKIIIYNSAYTTIYKGLVLIHSGQYFCTVDVWDPSENVTHRGGLCFREVNVLSESMF